VDKLDIGKRVRRQLNRLVKAILPAIAGLISNNRFFFEWIFGVFEVFLGVFGCFWVILR
jgi:hypothetical protein